MNDDTLLEFPCRFPVKVVGRDEPGFHAALQAILADHVRDQENLSLSERSSREGRFISVTVTLNATSREELDALYRALSASEHVIMAL